MSADVGRRADESFSGLTDNGASKSLLDIGMARVGLMGRYGAVAGGVYFGVDNTIGWGAVLEQSRRDAPSRCVPPLLPVLLLK